MGHIKSRAQREAEFMDAARVAVEQGLQAKSFALASRAYSNAVGLSLSADSLRRLTEGRGQQVEDHRRVEADRANGVGPWGESPREQRVAEVDPIAGLANLSTDGAMVLLRREGWKEAKLAAISEVQVQGPAAFTPSAALPSRLPKAPTSNSAATATKLAHGMPIRWPSINTPKACAAGLITVSA